MFAPHIESLYPVETIPPDFTSMVRRVMAEIYPQEVIQRLREGKYNPAIVGYIHDEGPRMQTLQVWSVFQKIAASHTTHPLKVALEIVPEQIGWIKEFLKDEREYKEHGTLWSKKPTEKQKEGLFTYRSKLCKSNAQTLALWLLENGFTVVSIEHEDVLKWTEQDRKRELIAGEGFLGNRWIELQPAFTAIRRDIYGLGVLDRECPDIISVGFYHALKYDLLLERDGSNSFYFTEEAFNWAKTLEMWREVHSLYLK